MSKYAQQVASMMSTAAGFDIILQGRVHSDSSAALDIAYRRGLGGETRHVKFQYLWIHEAVLNKELIIQKINGFDHPGD